MRITGSWITGKRYGMQYTGYEIQNTGKMKEDYRRPDYKV